MACSILLSIATLGPVVLQLKEKGIQINFPPFFGVEIIISFDNLD